VDVDQGLDRPHQPLALLTRRPFPQLPSFPIYLTDGRASNIVLQSIHVPISLTLELLEMITKFTLRIFEDIYNKVYEYDISKMSYWVVPIIPKNLNHIHSPSDPEQLLDMEQVRRVCHEPFWKWTVETKKDDLINRYFVDPMNGGRRYYSNCLAPHLKAQDPVPTNIPRQSHKFMSNILDYTDSKWLKSRDITKWNQNQPVLEVEKIPFRRNHLANVEDKEKTELEHLKTYICPEPLHISNVSSS
jgi:endoribonuclease Dicer